jgi:hypothetical protein
MYSINPERACLRLWMTDISCARASKTEGRSELTAIPAIHACLAPVSPESSDTAKPVLVRGSALTVFRLMRGGDVGDN